MADSLEQKATEAVAALAALLADRGVPAHDRSELESALEVATRLRRRW